MLAGFLELLQGVRTHRLEQRETGALPPPPSSDDERFVHQGCQKLERIVAGITTHGRGGIEAAAAGKDGQPPEEPLLRRREKIVAPIDEGLHRLLARQRRAIAAGKNSKALVELAGKLRQRQCPHARGRQLDRQRHSV